MLLQKKGEGEYNGQVGDAEERLHALDPFEFSLITAFFGEDDLFVPVPSCFISWSVATVHPLLHPILLAVLVESVVQVDSLLLAPACAEL